MPQTLSRPAVFLATGAGVGFCRYMPGTVGSLWGLPLVWGLQQVSGSWPVYCAMCAAAIAIAVPICSRAAAALGAKDPAAVVLDEIVALPLVFVAVPLDWTSAVIGFLWFRLFDIVKPWPIRRFERLPSGWGIVADDLIAGVFAALALRATLWIWNAFGG